MGYIKITEVGFAWKHKISKDYISYPQKEDAKEERKKKSIKSSTICFVPFPSQCVIRYMLDSRKQKSFQRTKESSSPKYELTSHRLLNSQESCSFMRSRWLGKRVTEKDQKKSTRENWAIALISLINTVIPFF